jgi:hypothetical protein
VWGEEASINAISSLQNQDPKKKSAQRVSR